MKKHFAKLSVPDLDDLLFSQEEDQISYTPLAKISKMDSVAVGPTQDDTKSERMRGFLIQLLNSCHKWNGTLPSTPASLSV